MEQGFIPLGMLLGGKSSSRHLGGYSRSGRSAVPAFRDLLAVPSPTENFGGFLSAFAQPNRGSYRFWGSFLRVVKFFRKLSDNSDVLGRFLRMVKFFRKLSDDSNVFGYFLRVVKFFRKLSDHSEKLLMLPGDCESFALYNV
ncbi:hypothetical protein PIB30_009460 [Stylosanthes scabra]|uniref:Uncharacterized protein n=1 Tax=Stylosanthes scabra TaxID=79078 RepID=A0ABU6X3F9_9FABA|nr:hypothetical protein [Stylosanthes scabra]